jgi:hypothetical protein
MVGGPGAAPAHPGAHGRDGTHRVAPVNVGEGLLLGPREGFLGGYLAWGHRIPFFHQFLCCAALGRPARTLA